jgi:transposase-like protein
MKQKERVIDFGTLEGERSSTGDVPKSRDSFWGDKLNPEVSTKKVRRRFSKGYKLSILKELDGCTRAGQKGAILRREGLYSSHITTWHKQFEYGKLTKKQDDKNREMIADLIKQNQRLTRELNQARLIMDAQKKILQIIELNEA